jgi:hypothetical protein
MHRDSSYSGQKGALVTTDVGNSKIDEKPRKSRWFWPFGVAATSVAGGLLLAFRGCWHRRMSWPVCAQGQCYQVCLVCGVKRLFDEKRFCSYGPFRYDLNELIGWAKAHQPEPLVDPRSRRPAS